jgi:hypothetical protein
MLTNEQVGHFFRVKQTMIGSRNQKKSCGQRSGTAFKTTARNRHSKITSIATKRPLALTNNQKSTLWLGFSTTFREAPMRTFAPFGSTRLDETQSTQPFHGKPYMSSPIRIQVKKIDE